jgi:two-component system sensor histidine kinase AdeS
LSTDAGERHAIVEVVDNGLGVPPKLRKEIFQEFVRVEGPNRGLAGGHGLGLAQVARTAAAHGGDVVCTEGLDGGARFSLRLAAAKG